jgi:hypothetical protein
VQISDVAWAPMSLFIPLGLVSLRARNASVVSVAETTTGAVYALSAIALDDNALAPATQVDSIAYLMALAATVRVLSCQRCGLVVDVAQLIPTTTYLAQGRMEELHLAQVSPTCLTEHGTARLHLRSMNQSPLADIDVATVSL